MAGRTPPPVYSEFPAVNSTPRSRSGLTVLERDNSTDDSYYSEFYSDSDDQVHPVTTRTNPTVTLESLPTYNITDDTDMELVFDCSGSVQQSMENMSTAQAAIVRNFCRTVLFYDPLEMYEGIRCLDVMLAQAWPLALRAIFEDDDGIELTRFNGTFNPITDRVNVRTEDEIRQFFIGIQDHLGAGTRFTEPFTHIFGEFMEKFTDGRKKKVFFLTDGLPNDYEEFANTYKFLVESAGLPNNHSFGVLFLVANPQYENLDHMFRLDSDDGELVDKRYDMIDVQSIVGVDGALERTFSDLVHDASHG